MKNLSAFSAFENNASFIFVSRLKTLICFLGAAKWCPKWYLSVSCNTKMSVLMQSEPSLATTSKIRQTRGEKALQQGWEELLRVLHTPHHLTVSRVCAASIFIPALLVPTHSSFTFFQLQPEHPCDTWGPGLLEVGIVWSAGHSPVFLGCSVLPFWTLLTASFITSRTGEGTDGTTYWLSSTAYSLSL